MKRLWVLVLVVVLAVVVSAVVWAQQGPGGPPRPEGDEGMMGGGRMMGTMGPVGVAASGDFVYVVTRGALLKYDSDLNLIRQTDLPEGERGMGGGRGGRGGGGRGGRGGGGRGMGRRGAM